MPATRTRRDLSSECTNTWASSLRSGSTRSTIDRAFIGSCTNSRIEDLREAAKVAKGYSVSSRVNAMVVPGSMQIKKQAEDEGLAKIFHRRRFRMARRRMLDVPRHERGHPASPANAVPRPATAISKAAKAAADAHISSRR